MAEMNPAAPGSSTSEHTLTVIAMVLGTVLEAAGGLIQTLQDTGHGAPWFPAVLAAVGAITQILALFGYQKSRTIVKTALISAAADVTKPSP